MTEHSLSTITSKIKSLEKTVITETDTDGKPHNSTLVALYYAYAGKFQLEDNIREAERSAKTAFKYLHARYGDALKIINPSTKSNILKQIHDQQGWLIQSLVITKLSFRNQLNLEFIKNMQSDIQEIAILRLYGNSAEFSIYIEILNAVNHYMRKNIIFISDGDAIPEFINSQLPNYVDLEAETSTTIDWLQIRILQRLVRQQRAYAHSDIGVAKKLARFREKSANLLMKLNLPDGYGADYVDSLVYRVIATKTKPVWSKYFRSFMELAEDLYSKNVIDKRTISQFYLKCYIRAFEITDSLPSKVEYLKLILNYAEQGRSVQTNYFLPLYYLLDIRNELDKNPSIKSVKNHIKTNHNQLIDASGTFMTDSNLIAKDLYESVISLLNKDYDSINNSTLHSLAALHNKAVIQKEDIYLKLLSRSLSVEIDSSGIMSGLVLASQNDIEDEEVGAFHDLEKLLISDEGPNVEVKLSMESGTLIKIAETICAFANGNGGKLVIGLVEKDHFSKALPEEDMLNFKVIADNFVLVGYKNFDRARTRLASHLKSKASLDGRSIDELYSISLQRLNNKQVGIIRVKPYLNIFKQLLLYDGKPYLRYDNQTMEMSFADANSRMSKFILS